MPVIVVRGADGEIHAFENRCAHRGALIALDDSGSTGSHFQCVYHAWTYDLTGNLVGIAFEKGSNGKGGMPAYFCKAEHGPRKLRTTVLAGLVFGTLSRRHAAHRGVPGRRGAGPAPARAAQGRRR